MPFEIAPQIIEVPTRFSKMADAMMRGCTRTHPIKGAMVLDHGGQQYACALGAAMVGGCGQWDIEPVRQAYYAMYRTSIERDNDSGRFSREQIAERIRAL